MIRQRAHQEGQKLSLKDEERRLKRDLDSDLYKDADTKYLHRAGDIKVLYQDPSVNHLVQCTCFISRS